MTVFFLVFRPEYIEWASLSLTNAQLTDGIVLENGLSGHHFQAHHLYLGLELGI